MKVDSGPNKYFHFEPLYLYEQTRRKIVFEAEKKV